MKYCFLLVVTVIFSVSAFCLTEKKDHVLQSAMEEVQEEQQLFFSNISFLQIPVTDLTEILGRQTDSGIRFCKNHSLQKKWNRNYNLLFLLQYKENDRKKHSDACCTGHDQLLSIRYDKRFYVYSLRKLLL